MSDSLAGATKPRMTHRQVLEALSGLLLGMFVSMLASTVVSTSLPVIIHDLDGNQAAFTWVVTATLLTTAISTPLWGKLADLTNRKVLYQLAIVIFVLATAAAGFSTNPEMLIAFRAVQGIGAGGLAALSQVLMADIISPRERGRYMGLFGAIMAVATIGGPLLGGVITDAWGWRWNFFVALPVAIVALILVQATLHVPARPKKKTSIDYVGIVLLSAAVSLLLIWVTNAGTATTGDWSDLANNDWWSLNTVLMVGGALIAAILFVIVELRSKEPLIPLTLFRNSTFTLSVIASIATGIAMFGASVFLSQYMQLARGATPTEAGLMTIPMIGGLLLSSIGVGALVTKYGTWKPYLIVGSILLVAGSYLLSTIHYDTDFFLVSVYMFLLGAGVGMTMQNLVLVVQNATRPEEICVASSGCHVLPQPRRHDRRLRHGRRPLGEGDRPRRRPERRHHRGPHEPRRQGPVLGRAAAVRVAAQGVGDARGAARRVRGHLRQRHLALVPHRRAVRGDLAHRDRVPAEQVADHDDHHRADAGE